MVTGDERKSFLQLDFRLKRKLSRSVMEMIAPPGILVMLSWVKMLLKHLKKQTSNLRFSFTQINFIIPADMVPGRMGLLMTIFLGSITIYNSVTEKSPRAGGSTNALVEWILACQIFIALAICEYSTILAFRKYGNISLRSGQVVNHEIDQNRGKKILPLMDMAMLVIFPVAFFTFTGIYWYTVSKKSILPSGM